MRVKLTLPAVYLKNSEISVSSDLEIFLSVNTETLIFPASILDMLAFAKLHLLASSF